MRDIVRVVLEGDEVTKLRGIMLDVTDRKQAEDALQQSDADLKLALEGSGLGLWKWNIITGEVSWSDRCKAIYGLPPDAAISYERFQAAVHPDDWERVLAALSQAVQIGTDYEIEKRILWPDGSVRWTASRGRVFCDAEGRRLRMAGVTMDITERKQAEEALRESEQRYKEIFDITSNCIFLLDATPDGRFKFAGFNPAEEKAVGIKNVEALGKFVEEVVPEQLARQVTANYRRCVAARTVIDYDEELELAIGRRSFHTTLIPLFDPAGRVHRLVGVAQDITERKQVEEALRQSEEPLRSILDNTAAVVFMLDPQNRYIFVNRQWEKLFHRTREEVRGKSLHDVWPKEFADAFVKTNQAVLEAHTPMEQEELAPQDDGIHSYISLKFPLCDLQGTLYAVCGIATDITERKRAEEALRRSEAMLLRAQAIGHIGSWTYDVAEGVFIGSEEGYRMCGWGPGPHRGEELLAIIHPEDLSHMQAAWQATLAGAPYQIEHRMVVRGQVRWVNVRAEPETDAGGKVIRVTGVTQDITERMRGEEALRDSLREKEALLKEVHHRVKNNLQLITSLLSLQASRIKDPAAREWFAESRNRVRAMSLVHENLYQAGNFVGISMAAHLPRLCSHLSRAYGLEGRQIQVVTSIADVCLDIDRAVPCGLIVNELVSNALKHAFPNGRAGQVRVNLDRPSADQAVLVVADDGVGLPSHLDIGRANSLGLQLVDDLTHQLHGTLAVSRDGGTTFTVTFNADSGQKGDRPLEEGGLTLFWPDGGKQKS
jgi:PAS domain S-box-containing protein